MELKTYFDNLRELTKTKQIKWERRNASGQHIFDCTITPENKLSIYFDNMLSRITIVVVDGESSIGISNLDANGDTYKSVAKLWDTILTLNLAKVAESWAKKLPELDKKIKFGPKEKVKI